jgi:hypothetical protein
MNIVLCWGEVLPSDPNRRRIGLILSDNVEFIIRITDFLQRQEDVEQVLRVSANQVQFLLLPNAWIDDRNLEQFARELSFSITGFAGEDASVFRDMQSLQQAAQISLAEWQEQRYF